MPPEDDDWMVRRYRAFWKQMIGWNPVLSDERVFVRRPPEFFGGGKTHAPLTFFRCQTNDVLYEK